MSKQESSHNFIRGSQIWAHYLRMLVQGLKNTIIVGICFSNFILIFRLCQYLDFSDIYYFAIQSYAWLKLQIFGISFDKSKIAISFYSLKQGKFIHLNAEYFITQFWRATPYGMHINKFLYWLISKGFFEMFKFFWLGIVIGILFFIFEGKRVMNIRKIRGGDIVKPNQLARLLQKKKMASNIKFNKLPLVKDSENRHILITGTTGSGKTNMINELIPQIRKLKQRAIIIDLNGNYYQNFFDPSEDTLLNPFEKDSVNWSPWLDATKDFEFDSLADCFFDNPAANSDPYWIESAKQILSVALEKESSNKSMSRLLDILTISDFKSFCQYFKGTFASGLASPTADKTTASTRSTLSNKITPLRYLPDNSSHQFSIN